MKKYLFVFFAITSFLTIWGQERINVAFYNVLNYPQAPPSNRAEILSEIVAQMDPDIFMICELESGAAGQDILNNSLNEYMDVYDAAPYQNNTSSNADLQQLLYFNRNKFELVTTDIIETTVRDINRYQLRLRTQNMEANPQFVEIFVAHLKASQGPENEQLRFAMVEEFTDYLTNLDPDVPLIFAGDLNLYSSNEAAYQELLNSSNPIVLKDPLDAPGDWNSNSNFAFLHTQSTRISNNEFGNFGAGGGLDSRFDFLLLSDSFFAEDAPLKFVENSYKAFGNNGNCYNDRIDDNSCSGSYSSELRDLLYQMSDHLPVVSQIETTEEFLNVPDENIENLAWFVRGNLAEDIIELAFAKAIIDKSDGYDTISVFNYLGQRIQKIPITETNLQINTSHLTQGVYYIQIDNSNTPPLKFLKIH